jgi:hypothetical protein
VKTYVNTTTLIQSGKIVPLQRRMRRTRERVLRSVQATTVPAGTAIAVTIPHTSSVVTSALVSAESEKKAR